MDESSINDLIVFADRHLLAVDKPAGVLVHGDGTGARTLTEAVRENTGIACAQPVQRLDVETTGLVLFSLDKAVQPALDALAAGHGMRKRYIALVAGRLDGERMVEQPIGRDRHDSRRMRVSKTGKPATTIVRSLAIYGNRTLVEVELLTGRRHQIRVHLSSIGHPIAGDALYQGPASSAGLMLHALEERFEHPVTGEELVLRTEWPRRFSAFPPPACHEWSILNG